VPEIGYKKTSALLQEATINALFDQIDREAKKKS
jgi:hypothetical protein